MTEYKEKKNRHYKDSRPCSNDW